MKISTKAKVKGTGRNTGAFYCGSENMKKHKYDKEQLKSKYTCKTCPNRKDKRICSCFCKSRICKYSLG